MQLYVNIGLIFFVTVFAIGTPFLLLKKLFEQSEKTEKFYGTHALLFLLGILTAVALVCFKSVFSSAFVVQTQDPYAKAAFKAFVEAALLEEAFKLIPAFLFVALNKRFTKYAHGAIFAVLVGMGFAFAENIEYILMGSRINRAFLVAFLRAFTSIPGHYIFGVIMGYFLSLAIFGDSGRRHIFRDGGGWKSATFARKRKFFTNLAAAYFFSVLAHGAYDYFAMTHFSMLWIFAFYGAYKATDYINERLLDRDVEIERKQRRRQIEERWRIG